MTGALSAICTPQSQRIPKEHYITGCSRHTVSGTCAQVSFVFTNMFTWNYSWSFNNTYSKTLRGWRTRRSSQYGDSLRAVWQVRSTGRAVTLNFCTISRLVDLNVTNYPSSTKGPFVEIVLLELEGSFQCCYRDISLRNAIHCCS
jgi:hypothetical protein